VNETTDSVGLFIDSLVAGKLDIEVPHNPHLICSEVLHHINHSTLARFVSWPTGVHEVLILYSDAAAYTLKAATALKVFYPNLIHFTCLAHGLQRVAEEVTAKVPQVNKLISMTEKVFLKVPHRAKSYKKHLPGAPLPLPLKQCKQDGEPG
jgi:hypothetical protein